jgi:hypothetical protein
MAKVPSREKPVNIIVRRGALRRFDKLKTQAEGLPVKVTWDRRLGERRKSSSAAPAERRGPDRRKQPSFTWELADFVVVEPEDDGQDKG